MWDCFSEIQTGCPDRPSGGSGGGTFREVCSIINAPCRLQSKRATASVCMEIMLGNPIALQRPKTIKIPISKEMVYDIILYQ